MALDVLQKKMTVHLTETSEWAGVLFNLTIDAGEARFTGADIYEGRFPDVFALKKETIEQIEGAFR